MKNKLTERQKLEKKLEKYKFWRHCYIFPLFLSTVLLTTLTFISLTISMFTGNFAVTCILALCSLFSAGTSFAGYKFNDFVDNKFHAKICKLRKEIENLDNEILNYHSQLPVKANEGEIVTAKLDMFGNFKIYKVKEKEIKKLENQEDKHTHENNLDL